RRPSRSVVARASPRARGRQWNVGRRKISSSGNGTRARKSSFGWGRAGDPVHRGARALVVSEKALHGLVTRGANAPVESVRARTYDPPIHDREVNGGGETRGRGAPVDRGGRCVVRVPRGDPEPVREPLPRDRAVGLVSPVAAPACDQGASGEAAARRGVGSTAKRCRAASPSTRVPPYAIAALSAHAAVGPRSSS